jgi:hypothetical protein
MLEHPFAGRLSIGGVENELKAGGLEDGDGVGADVAGAMDVRDANAMGRTPETFADRCGCGSSRYSGQGSRRGPDGLHEDLGHLASGVYTPTYGGQDRLLQPTNHAHIICIIVQVAMVVVGAGLIAARPVTVGNCSDQERLDVANK